LVAVRGVVLATAIIVTAFLMPPLAQFGTVKANPYTFSPGIDVYSPSPGEVYREPNVEIYFKIILDEYLAQIDSFFYTLDNQARVPLIFTRGTEDHHVNYDEYFPKWETYTVNTITVHKTLNLTDGVHRIAVFAHRSDGTIESIMYRSITVDSTLPDPYAPFTPVIVSPVNQTTYNTNEVPLTYTIEKGILWSYYYIDSNDDMKYFEGNITLSNLSEGQRKLGLSVYTTTDPSSQHPNHRAGHVVIFYVDTSPPKIGNVSVYNIDSGGRLLNFTVDEEAIWVGYSLDNQANVTVSDEPCLGDLSFGSHNVTVYAEDAVGNMGASETLFFNIEPFPTALVIASAVTVTTIGAGLLVYFKKRKH
jgi:hypothetical protein